MIAIDLLSSIMWQVTFSMRKLCDVDNESNKG